MKHLIGNILAYLIILLLSTVCVTTMSMLQSCGGNENMEAGNPDTIREMQTLLKKATAAAQKEDFHLSDSLGNRLYQLADLADNDLYRINALICMSYSMRKNPDTGKRLRYLRQAEKLLAGIDNDTVTARLYNVMGVFTFDDFDNARKYFSKSLEAARKSKITDMEMMAECNLAEIYRRSGDTLGIRYDMDIYDFATRTGNDVMRHAAAVRCAEYYMKDSAGLPVALRYINDIRDMKDQQFYYHYLRSKWLLAKDSIDKAMKEWNSASETGIITPGYLLAGGRLYNIKGDHRKSKELLERADSGYAAIDSLNTERIDLLRIQSSNLKSLGMTARALELMERYTASRDSILDLRNSRDINSFKVKFDTEKKEILIASQKASIKSRNVMLAMAGLFLIAVVAGFLIYIWRRNRFYRLIVEQQKEFVTRQNTYAPFLRPPVVTTSPEIEESDSEEMDAEVPFRKQRRRGSRILFRKGRPDCPQKRRPTGYGAPYSTRWSQTGYMLTPM